MQPTTIKTLNELAVHCSGIPSPRTYPEEFRLYEVTGRITVAKSENDHDYHVALADLDEPAYTIVTEIADPLCDGAVQSPFRLLLSSARSTFDSVIGGHAISSLVGAILKVRGIGFYDFNHREAGRKRFKNLLGATATYWLDAEDAHWLRLRYEQGYERAAPTDGRHFLSASLGWQF